MCTGLKVEDLARICHEANRAYCLAIGDNSQLPWDEAQDWQRQSMILGVECRLANPDAPESAQHEAWMAHKIMEGWKHGTVKDDEGKTHPCIMPYEQLPAQQRLKDALHRAIIDALTPALAVDETNARSE